MELGVAALGKPLHPSTNQGNLLLVAIPIVPGANMTAPQTPRYTRLQQVSPFRQIAPLVWDSPRDPTIYGHSDIDAEALMVWLAEQRSQTGVRLTPTHAVSRALALVLRDEPELNVLLRRGRVWQRNGVDIYLQVVIQGEGGGMQGVDTTGALIRDADRKPIVELATELAERAARLRARQDNEVQALQQWISRIPPLLMKPLMKLLGTLSYDFGLPLKKLGIQDDLFGSMMVSSLGMHGIRYAYAPLFGNARCVGIVLVGAVYDAAVVRDGQIVVRKILPLSLSADHRLLDGMQCSVLSQRLHAYLENPARLA